MPIKVYVGDLLEGVQRDELYSAFSRYGPLEDVWIARNPPGFAFVFFANKREAEKACQRLDGKEVCGSRIRVEIAKAGKDKHFNPPVKGWDRHAYKKRRTSPLPRRQLTPPHYMHERSRRPLTPPPPPFAYDLYENHRKSGLFYRDGYQRVPSPQPGYPLRESYPHSKDYLYELDRRDFRLEPLSRYSEETRRVDSRYETPDFDRTRRRYRTPPPSMSYQPSVLPDEYGRRSPNLPPSRYRQYGPPSNRSRQRSPPQQTSSLPRHLSHQFSRNNHRSRSPIPRHRSPAPVSSNRVRDRSNPRNAKGHKEDVNQRRASDEKRNNTNHHDQDRVSNERKHNRDHNHEQKMSIKDRRSDHKRNDNGHDQKRSNKERDNSQAIHRSNPSSSQRDRTTSRSTRR